MSSLVDLTATFIPNDGELQRVQLALDIAIEQVVEEPGCVRYEITDTSAERIVLTEQWESEELLQKHLKGTAVQDLGESLSGLLAEPVRIDRAV